MQCLHISWAAVSVNDKTLEKKSPQLHSFPEPKLSDVNHLPATDHNLTSRNMSSQPPEQPVQKSGRQLFAGKLQRENLEAVLGIIKDDLEKEKNEKRRRNILICQAEVERLFPLSSEQIIVVDGKAERFYTSTEASKKWASLNPAQWTEVYSAVRLIGSISRVVLNFIHHI